MEPPISEPMPKAEPAAPCNEASPPEDPPRIRSRQLILDHDPFSYILRIPQFEESDGPEKSSLWTPSGNPIRGIHACVPPPLPYAC